MNISRYSRQRGDDADTLWRDGEVLHFANAHTDGDIIVHIASANIVHMGDLLFSGRYPFIDLDAGGSVHGFIAALDEIVGFTDDETRFIVGHGPLSSRDDLIASRDMLVEGRARCRSGGRRP